MRHIIFLNGIWPNRIEHARTHFTRSISCYQLKYWLSTFGFNSQIIDFCQILSTNEIFNLIERFISKETFAIGVSTTFWPTDKQIPPNIRISVQRIKDKYPHLKIISGGARKPWNPEFFDKHFIGESENQLVEWCQSQVNKSSLLNRKFNIVNLSHRFDDTDAILENESLPIELGRGCIFKCKFCSHHNLGKPKFTYQRDFNLILDEIKYNYEKFGTTRYMLLDDTVNEDLDKIQNLSTIKEKTSIDIEWVGYLRADLIWSKPDSADMLMKSGLKSCFFGIETFNPLAGKSIDKGWGAKHGKEYLPKLYKDIWGEQINIHINLIAGLPYETIESLNESLDWCKSQDIGCRRFVPLSLYVEKNDNFASSEFTRNYPSYGYKNVDHDSGYWESDTMNSLEALKFCENAQKILVETNRVSSWEIFNGVNLGFETKDVMNWNYKKLWRTSIAKVNHFKIRYIEKLKSINI